MELKNEPYDPLKSWAEMGMVISLLILVLLLLKVHAIFPIATMYLIN